MNFKLSVTLTSAAALFSLSGCVFGENKQFFESSSTARDTAGGKLSGSNGFTAPGTGGDPLPTATPHAVCDPFGDGSVGGSRKNGIKGKMYYMDDAAVAQYPHSQVSDYYQYGKLADADFYFNNLFVPTRAFDQGFALEDGSLLSKSDGTPLFENFAFDFKTEIKLPQGSRTRNMQFALLADDGANLLVQDPITKLWTTSVNDDGTHGTVMACGSAPVAISDVATPMQIQYYQGPRYHISLVLLWREWTGSSFSPNDPWCGQGGNDLFFNSSVVPSAAQQPWDDLMTRWEVVPAEVFHIGGAQENPCN